MNRKIRITFLALIILQAIHSTEEYAFRFYEKFPPMRFIYQNFPDLAQPAFVIFNLLLFIIGLISFFYCRPPARKRARTVVWVWIALESANVIAHLGWAALIRGYNPGLVTVVLFVPVVIYLGYLMRRSISQDVTGC